MPTFQHAAAILVFSAVLCGAVKTAAEEIDQDEVNPAQARSVWLGGQSR